MTSDQPAHAELVSTFEVCCSLILERARASHSRQASSACTSQRSVTKFSLVELFSPKLYTSRQPKSPNSIRLAWSDLLSRRVKGHDHSHSAYNSDPSFTRHSFPPLVPPPPPVPVPTIQKLLRAGADPTIRMASTNVSPLETVASVEKVATDPTLGPSLVRALTEAGARVNGVGLEGLTALHLACYEGACGKVVQALLDAGADAVAPCAGMQFLTPLQLAGLSGNVEALRVLIGRPECKGLDAIGAPPERCGEIKCGVDAGVVFVPNPRAVNDVSTTYGMMR